MKPSTTIEGIFVQPFTHNRCPEDGWSGPDAEGVYTCSRPGDWSQEPVDDGFITWTGQGRSVYAFPLMTLASTGLPDPDVPLGLSPRVLGSTTLADAEWEDCTWPATFIPDRIRMWDDQPGRGRAPYASFDGQTYRLGKDGEEGVVMGLLTAQQRDFCPN